MNAGDIWTTDIKFCLFLCAGTMTNQEDGKLISDLHFSSQFGELLFDP